MTLPRIMTYALLLASALCISAEERILLRCNAALGYLPFNHAAPDGLRIDARKAPGTVSDSVRLRLGTSDFDLSFRAAAKGEWTLALTDTTARKSLEIRLKRTEIDNLISSVAGIAADAFCAGATAHADITGGIDCGAGQNAWLASRRGDTMSLYGGDRDYTPRLDISLPPGFSADILSFSAGQGTSLHITDIFLSADDALHYPAARDMNSLGLYLLSASNPSEGYWMTLDSSLDDTMLRLGGDYTLALVADGDCFDIIYIDGAVTNPGLWRQGMTKGRLEATPFDNIFNVVWYDSEHRALSHGIKAQFESPSLLSISFPFHNSSLRLQRCSGPSL